MFVGLDGLQVLGAGPAVKYAEVLQPIFKAGAFRTGHHIRDYVPGPPSNAILASAIRMTKQSTRPNPKRDPRSCLEFFILPQRFSMGERHWLIWLRCRSAEFLSLFAPLFSLNSRVHRRLKEGRRLATLSTTHYNERCLRAVR